MHVLDELNARQRRAVESGDGPVLIIAGPGTGKTKTLTARIAYLLEVKKVAPAELVALTFTNKAAREMRERLQKYFQGTTLETGKVVGPPGIMTFHALGAELLKRHGFGEKLLNGRQRTEIIRGLAKPAELKSMSSREVELLISRAKTSLSDSLDDSTHQLLKRYETALMEQGLHDFDDLLAKTFKLLQADVSRRPHYKYVLVDEFQDTSEMQYELLKLLGTGEKIFAIGDPNQAIYGFRGAGAEMFGRFRKDYPEVMEIDLTINYRSRPEIIRLANAIFPGAPQLEAYHKTTGSVHTLQTLNEYSEAAYILSEIEKGIGGSDMLKASGDQNVHEPRDYAVLYRTHRAAKAVQRAFAESGVPHQIAGEGSPYEQPEIQAVIAIMRYLHLPSEMLKAELVKLSLLKRPALTHVEALRVKFNNINDMAVCDLAASIAEALAFGQADRHQTLQQFLGSLVQFGNCETGLGDCLEHIDSISENEFYDPSINAVTLLTIHAAKGLEFDHVFLVATEEGILPKTNKAGEDNLGEERRLFYVALTRAKEKLEILHTKTRGGQSSSLSRFAAELPEAILPRALDPDMAILEHRATKRRQKRAQASLF